MRVLSNFKRYSKWLVLTAPVFLAASFSAHAIVDCSGISVGSGHDADSTLHGAVLYKNFRNGTAGTTNSRARVGTDPANILTSSSNSMPHTVQWKNNSSVLNANPVSFESVTASNKLKSTVTGQDATSSVAEIAKTLSNLNYVEIYVRNKLTDGTGNELILENVSINGCPIDFDSSTPLVVDGLTVPRNSEFIKHVKGLDLLSGGDFVITADIKRDGTIQDSSDTENAATSASEVLRSIQVSVGYIPLGDVEAPVVTSVVVPGPVYINGQATVNATVDDTGKGDSNIASAEYKLNDAADWTPMDPVDDLDSKTEDFTASFTAAKLGLNTVCVRGYDVYNNRSAENCQTFAVTYKFTGFFEPINEDADEVLQLVKAGRAIPAKWRLTDANDMPIEDTSSFAGLFYTSISCTEEPDIQYLDYVGDDAGTSGLQYNDDGYWQYNWKTEKGWTSSCKAMYVRFNDGAVSPVALFKFYK